MKTRFRWVFSRRREQPEAPAGDAPEAPVRPASPAVDGPSARGPNDTHEDLADLLTTPLEATTADPLADPLRELLDEDPPLEATASMPVATPDPPAPESPQPAIIEGLMIEAFGASDPGCVRSNNEDTYLVVPSMGLYLVADGMGGAQAGEHASRMAADTVREMVVAAAGKVDPEGLVAAFQQANDRVKAAATENPDRRGMGTTLVAAVERENDLLVASVGDSRAYAFRDGTLTPVTEDQSWVNEVGRRLGFDEESLKNHPMRHVLTMAIGVSDDLRVNVYTVDLVPGTLVLLCSDGLHGVVPEPELVALLGEPGTLESRCGKLIAAAREHGAPDNVTVILLRVPPQPPA